MKPLAIDLFCGLGGWTEGLLSEGYFVVGFDIERHVYGDEQYPAQLVLQDVLTLHGKQFKDAALIVASPPCQEYSYMAMPWSIAKQKRREYLDGTRDRKDLTALFDACFRIQREACEAAGKHIPLVVENVRGACEWVGRSRWNFGSFHLWGDVPALMPMNKAIKNTGGSWFAVANNTESGHSKNPVHALTKAEGQKTAAHPNKRDGHPHMKHLTNPGEHGVKFSQSGAAWFDGTPRDKMLGERGPAAFGSKSSARKAASARIAKIPLPLSQHIARYWKPLREVA